MASASSSVFTVYSILICLLVQLTLSSLIWNQWNISTWNTSSVDNSTGEPLITHAFAIGYYNDSVWLLGGISREQYVLEIDLVQKRAMHHPNVQSPRYSDWDQRYWQRGSVLFISKGDKLNIFGYDLRLQETTYTIPKYNITNFISDGGVCITGIDDYLFQTGGLGSDTSFYLYDFNTELWSKGPLMPHFRAFHSCTVLNYVLYVIGGRSNVCCNDTTLNSVIVIDVAQQTSLQSWIRFPANLSFPRVRSRSVAYNQFIYVVGGESTKQGNPTAYVEVIDTVNQQISRDTDLIRKKRAHSVIIVDTMLCLFGGVPYDSFAAYNDNIYPQYAQLPTAAPTTGCVDYHSGMQMDGADYHGNLKSDDILHAFQTFPSDVNVQTFNSTETESGLHGFTDQAIECAQANASACFVACYDVGHCLNTKIETVANTEWGEVRLVCTEPNACSSLQLIVHSKVDVVSIFCGTFACEGMQVIITAVANINVSIECVEEWSCKDMSVYLGRSRMDEDLATIHGDIRCYDDNACDNFVITTDDLPDIFIQLHAMRYSEDIQISHHYYNNIQIQCGVADEERYIRYDTNYLLNEYELLQLARKEYPTTRRLPCEDIQILCSNNTDFDRNCEYKYKLNVSLFDILQDEDRPICYWLNIQQVYKAECKGTCGDEIQYNAYNVSFELDLVFESEQDENINHSYIVCDEYFGSDNATDDSLTSIDAVFFAVLDFISLVPGSIIHSILTPPHTVELEEAKCENKPKNIIRLSSDLSLDSVEDNQTIINRIFAQNGEFINASSILLSQLFDIRVIIISHIYIDDNPQIPIRGISEEIVAAIVLSALCIIGVTGSYVCVSHTKRKRNKEALTTYIRNAMVIFIGIAEYEYEPSHPEVDGYCANLDGIDVDEQNVNHFFGTTLNYNIVSKHVQTKCAWKLEELRNFLEENAEELHSNVGTIYDGLVVILSSHGIKDYVVTSDYKKIAKTEIHRIFTVNKPQNRTIPRVFLFDCCDGPNVKQVGIIRGDKDDDAAAKGADTMQSVAELVEPNQTTDCDDDAMVDIDLDKTHARVSTKGHALEENPEFVLQASVPSVEDEGPWLENEMSLDFRLVTIYAANEGFQSILNSKKGSYAIMKFIHKMAKNVENGNKKWLFEICDEIQSELHSHGKQHTVSKFNDGMRYLKFKRNSNNNEKMTDGGNSKIELITDRDKKKRTLI
eukprot:1102283_1